MFIDSKNFCPKTNAVTHIARPTISKKKPLEKGKIACIKTVAMMGRLDFHSFSFAKIRMI
jgi:hypothetical protein